MSTPDQRARDKDRDAAIEVVEGAWADGQIVEAVPVDRTSQREEYWHWDGHDLTSNDVSRRRPTSGRTSVGSTVTYDSTDS